MNKRGYKDLYRDISIWRDILGIVFPDRNIRAIKIGHWGLDEFWVTCKATGLFDITIVVKDDGRIFVYTKEKVWSDLEDFDASIGSVLGIINSLLANNGYVIRLIPGRIEES